MKKKLFLYVSILVLVIACNKDSKIEQDIAKIEVDFKVERFDELFFKAQPSDLPQLKASFPFLFSKHISDSVWISNMKDTLQKHLLKEVELKFSNFEPYSNSVKSLFQHLKYYDKTFNAPRVITLTNFVDYRNKTIVTDTIVLIALDNYLGKDHDFYYDIPKYIAQNMEPTQMVSDLASEFSKKYIYQSQNKTLLDDMIFYGKQLYFKDIMIPFESDANKIGYTQEQIDWAISNESYIWRYFIEKELLYSTDNKMPSRFINPAPFTKFYLELDSESPGRLGQYMGWQIVRSYMEHNNVDLYDMLQKDANEIFNDSKFKPRK